MRRPISLKQAQNVVKKIRKKGRRRQKGKVRKKEENGKEQWEKEME